MLKNPSKTYLRAMPNGQGVGAVAEGWKSIYLAVRYYKQKARWRSETKLSTQMYFSTGYYKNFKACTEDDRAKKEG